MSDEVDVEELAGRGAWGEVAARGQLDWQQRTARVDALDGRPGVYSARYAGKDATDDSNIDKLLAALSDVAWRSTSAGVQYWARSVNSRGRRLR